MERDPLCITLDAAQASDKWGFVGRVMIGDVEAYRTLEAFSDPVHAKIRVQEIVGNVLGPLLAGEEWRQLRELHGHTPRREDLMFGMGGNGQGRSEETPD